MNYYKNIITTSILAALSLGTAQNSFAAEQKEKDQNKESEIEIIEVTGYAASLKRSMNAKRFADQVVDGISAEDMGKLPDDNIAEALSRVVGVSMSRSEGEGEQVSIRGMDPSLSKITINGQDMASSIDSRSFNLNNIASELVSAIEVFKSPTASMTEGSLGGQVNLKTSSPLTVGKQLARLSAKAERNTVSEKNAKSLSALYSNVFNDDTIGILANINYYERTIGTESLESGGWELMTKSPYVSDSEIPDPITGVSNKDVWRIKDMRSHFKTDERERLGGNLTLEWQASDNLNINLNTLYTTQKRTFDMSMADFDFHNGSKTDPVADSIRITGDNVTSLQTTLKAKNKSKTNIGYNGFHREYKEDSISSTLKVDWELENWTFVPTISFSKATGTQDYSNTKFSTKVEGLGYNIPSQYHTEVILPQSFDADDLGQFELGTYAVRNYDVEETKNTAQIDANYTFDDNDIFSSFALGIRYSDTDKDNKQYRDSIASKIATEHGSKLTLENYASLYSNQDFLVNAPTNTWYVTDIVKMDTDWKYLADLQEYKIESWGINEKISAAYIQGNIDSELWSIPVRGNLGVRYVYTENNLTGFKETKTGPDKVYTPNDISNDYDDILPSFNLAFELSKEFILRTSAAKVMARPNYKDLSPVYREVTGSTRVTKGNPELDPYRADQYNLSAEWYFNNEGLLSVGLFYNDIESYIYKDTVEEEINGEDTDVTQPINGESATVKGVEFSYQQHFSFLPSPFDGLGTAFNYTYNDSDTDLVNDTTGEALTLPGLSKDTVNATLYYEKYGFSARIAYTYRSEYFNVFALSGEGRFVDDYQQIDVNIGYDINKSLSVDLAATNLTDETLDRYVGNSSRLFDVKDSGRNYTLTARYKF